VRSCLQQPPEAASRAGPDVCGRQVKNSSFQTHLMRGISGWLLGSCQLLSRGCSIWWSRVLARNLASF
jgi:hypothetical protein